MCSWIYDEGGDGGGGGVSENGLKSGSREGILFIRGEEGGKRGLRVGKNEG